MLHVGVFNFPLRLDVRERVVIRGFRGAEKSRGVEWDKTGLPAFLQILAWITNHVRFRNEGAPEMDEVTDCRAHADRVPPRRVDLDRWIGQIAGHHELRVEHRGIGVTHAAGTGCVYEQYGPLRAARAGRECFVAVDDVTAVDAFDRRAELHCFAGFARLRFAAPRDPLLAAFNYTFEPARLLFFSAHAVEQYERVDVTLPTAGER